MQFFLCQYKKYTIEFEGVVIMSDYMNYNKEFPADNVYESERFTECTKLAIEFFIFVNFAFIFLSTNFLPSIN